MFIGDGYKDRGGSTRQKGHNPVQCTISLRGAPLLTDSMFTLVVNGNQYFTTKDQYFPLFYYNVCMSRDAF